MFIESGICTALAQRRQPSHCAIEFMEMISMRQINKHDFQCEHPIVANKFHSIRDVLRWARDDDFGSALAQARRRRWECDRAHYACMWYNFMCLIYGRVNGPQEKYCETIMMQWIKSKYEIVPGQGWKRKIKDFPSSMQTTSTTNACTQKVLNEHRISSVAYNHLHETWHDDNDDDQVKMEFRASCGRRETCHQI